MSKRFAPAGFCLVCFFAFATMAQAQPKAVGKFWQTVAQIPQNRPAADAWVRPEKFHAFNVDQAALRATLAKTPKEFSLQARTAPEEISLPMPDGSMARFKIVESLVMAPELAAKFPEIKTYLGQGIDDPSATVRFDLTPAGFHAQILSPIGAVYIDPYWRGDAVLHTSYYKRDYRKAADGFKCLVTEDAAKEIAQPLVGDDSPRSGNFLRTYRLACAADGEYVAFHGGTVSAGMAAIVTAINRVTGVYETELAIRLVLVANNNLIVYTDAGTDPYTDDNPTALLNENQSNLDSVIGTANYDIGHVFTTGGGGVATVGIVCVAGFKARGVTGLSAPTGDAFYIDFVAHEMGHQFSGRHTFNSETAGNCTVNTRVASSAYEPGSGSTIMAYAGICPPDNLQAHSDPYFHSQSFDQILAYSTTGSGNSCPATTATGNSFPVVNAGSNYTIPISTPFTLTATGSDPNGDALTYCWEERDLGAAQALSDSDNGSSPLFRSLSPTSSPSRTFPKLANILNNTASLGERLPTLSRTMNFRVTVRDNRAGGGGVNTSNMTVTVSATAGPFLVTSPNTAVSWSGARTVAWNVAGTTGAPVNAANVNILLSTNGGNSFQFVLATNTPNDGGEIVLLPNLTSSTARIKVEGAGNIFFDISDANFSITPGAAGPFVTLDTTTLVSENCAPTNNRIDPGETVTVNFTLKNTGSANTTNLVATLLAVNGVLSPSGPQSYGVLVAGGSAVGKTFSFAANGTCGGTLQAAVQLQDGAANLGTITNSFTLGSVVSTIITNTINKTNTTFITIPDSPFDSQPASPYPTANVVSGATGLVTKATVTILSLSHSFPDDIDMILVAPNNQTVMLMSDAGGSGAISGVNLTFDSLVGSTLPGGPQITSGTYQPVNYVGNDPDTFPAPAPSGPYGSSLTNLNGINPNGTWSLYVVDSYAVDGGSISGGWKLTLTTTATNTVSSCCVDNTPPSVQSVFRAGNNVTLSWNSIPGRTYRIQYKDDLNTVSWTNLAGDIAATGTTATKIDNTATPAQRFYRMILLP